MSIPSHVDVAIVGGGPAGLAAACTLRQRGVNVIVLDAAAEPSTGSRATVIHSRTLEVLDGIDLTARIIQQGEPLTKWSICAGNNILTNLDFSTLRAKYPMVVTLAQSETEALLRERLQELGGTIYRSAQVIAVMDSGDQVKLEVSTSTTKTTVTAKYVIAADGLRSTVREAMAIPFEGGEYSTSFVTADCKFSCLGPLKQDTVQLYLSPEGFMLFIPMPHGIWRIVGTLDDAPKDANITLYQHLVDTRVPGGTQVQELTWSSRFHIHHRLAAKYRKGRVFIAGDAAHVHSPAGGQGMNIGIQDGARLGEIVSEAVIAGKRSNEALDRYEFERRPVAKGVVALTHRITVMSTLKSPLLIILRNWCMWMAMSVPFVKSWMISKLAELEH